MRAYLVVFLISLLMQVIPVHTDKEKRWRVFFTFVPIFLFGALRIDFGLDYSNYEDIFYYAHYWHRLRDVSEHSEMGYVILNRIIPSWRLFLILTSGIVCVGSGVFFYKCVPSEKSWVAVILLFLAGDKSIFFMYSGIRNAIAVAIMLMSLPLIRDRKWLLYLLLTILAMQFHTSALLFMPIAYLLANGKQMSKRESTLWIIALIVLQVVSLEYIFTNATSIVEQYLERYGSYAEKAETLGDTRTLLVRLSSTVFVLGMLWFMRTTALSDNENTVCRLALIFALSGLFGALNVRMNQCFILPFLCGVVVLVGRWEQKWQSNLYLSFCIVYMGYAFFKVFMQNEFFSYQIYHSVIGDF